MIKGSLFIALMLVAVVKNYAHSLLEVHYEGLSYSFPVSYIFLSLFVFCVLSWLIAYQWQALKIYFLRWSLLRTKKELSAAQQKISDTYFYFNFLDQEKKIDVFRAMTQQQIFISQKTELAKQIQILSQAIVDRNQAQVTGLMKELSRKMPPAVYHVLEGRLFLAQLKKLHDPQGRLAILKKIPQSAWEYTATVQELLEDASSWSLEEQSYLLKKIDPMLLSGHDFVLLEGIIKADPSSWLVYFYEQHWQEMVERSLDLALFLVKLNVHLGFVGQAQQITERLPPSLVKGLLQNALRDPDFQQNELLKLTQV